MDEEKRELLIEQIKGIYSTNKEIESRIQNYKLYGKCIEEKYGYRWNVKSEPCFNCCVCEKKLRGVNLVPHIINKQKFKEFIHVEIILTDGNSKFYSNRNYDDIRRSQAEMFREVLKYELVNGTKKTIENLEKFRENFMIIQDGLGEIERDILDRFEIDKKMNAKYREIQNIARTMRSLKNDYYSGIIK